LYGFVADLADSGGFGVSINKKQLFFSLFLAFLGIYYLPVNQSKLLQIILDKKIFCFRHC
jgi:hypothetical protein